MKSSTARQQETRRLRWQRRFLAMEAFDPTCPREVRGAIRERLDSVQERIDRQAQDYADYIEREAEAAEGGEDWEPRGPVPVGLREVV